MVVENKPEYRAFPPVAGIGEPDLLLLPLMGGIWEKCRRWAERQLKTLGMTFPQYMALAALSVGEGVSQRELAKAMDVDTTTMTVVCDSLEKKRLLKRQRDPCDRRANRLFLTNTGREAYATAHPVIQDGVTRVFAGIPPDRLEATLQLLWGLYRNAAELLEEGE